MTVSLVVIFYNSERYLEQCLSSAIAQTRPFDQIVVVDDGSTDKGADVVRVFERCHPNLRLIQHGTNRGRAVARQTGLDAATGDIVVFMDSDARATPGIVERTLDLYRQWPDAGAIGGRAVETCRESLADHYRCNYYALSWGERSGEVPHIFGIYMTFPRQVLLNLETPELDDPLENDSDLCLRVRTQGRKLYTHPDLLVYHMRHDTMRSLFRMVFHWNYCHRAAELRRGFAKRNPLAQVFRSAKAMLVAISRPLSRPREPLLLLRPFLCAMESYAMLKAELDAKPSSAS